MRPALAAARALECLAGALPPRGLLALADLAGTLWWLLSPGRRRVVRENLRIAFGDGLAARRTASLGRACCRGLARVFAELALADRLLASPRARARRLSFRGDWEQLATDAKTGGGLIVTAHLGNWEVGALAARARGIPLEAMARPQESPVVEAWLTRRRGGATAVLRKKGGMTGLLRSLRRRRWIALLADQNAGRHGTFVPFFGLEASTFPTPAALAARMGVPLYLGVCLRRPGAMRFEVHVERLPPPAPDGVREATRDLNRRLEAWIRRAPQQYNWVHRRWKTRPPGRDASEPGQPFYARLWPVGHPRTGLR